MRQSAYILFIILIIITGCYDSERDVPAPTIYFASDGNYEIDLGDTLILRPRILYDQHSTYLWTKDNEVICDTLDCMFVPQERGDYKLRFSVTTNKGEDSKDVNICVRKLIDFKTMENLNAKGTDKLILLPDSGENFICNDVTLYNVVNSDTTGWSGFAYSNRTKVQAHLLSAAIGTPYTTNQAKESQHMVVGGDYGYIMLGGSYTIKSISIANDNFCYLCSKFGGKINGDIQISPFEKGDYLKVRFTAYNGDMEETAHCESYLINCQDDNPARFYRMTDWTTVDLTGLGKMEVLHIEIEGSAENHPKMVCIDDIKLQ